VPGHAVVSHRRRIRRLPTPQRRVMRMSLCPIIRISAGRLTPSRESSLGRGSIIIDWGFLPLFVHHSADFGVDVFLEEVHIPFKSLCTNCNVLMP
jgi:hypothetical protein